MASASAVSQTGQSQEAVHLLRFCCLVAHGKGIAFQASYQMIILSLGQCSCGLLDGSLQQRRLRKEMARGLMSDHPRGKLIPPPALVLFLARQVNIHIVINQDLKLRSMPSSS